MLRRSVVLASVAVLAGSLALTACGERSSSAGSGSGGDGKKAVIGVIAPLSGDLSAMGLGIKNSVALAIKQANESKAIPGWTIELDAQDDEGKPEPGKNVASKLASNDNVVGVVGTLNSSVAQQVQPVLKAADIAQVSPANTNPALSRGDKFKDAPNRVFPNYFRTCATDSVQGPFAANYLISKGIKQVATVHDKKTYGQGLVTAFTEEFTKKGGKVVVAETINPDDANFMATITKLKAANPQAVYYGGEYPQAGPLSKQAKDAGLTVPLMGGDGIYDPKFIAQAGPKSEKDMATSVGAPTDKMPKGQKFLADYKAAGYAEDASAYGAYGFDAANAIIEALKVSLKDASSAKDARKKTIEALGKVSFEGISGPVSFDEFGDTKSRVLTVYTVTGGKWAATETKDAGAMS